MQEVGTKHCQRHNGPEGRVEFIYDSMSDLGEIRVYWRADFQSGSRVLKKVF